MISEERTDLLFLCVANSARSQMAEGFARRLAPQDVAVHSAGSAPGKLNPHAVHVMQEAGIDISSHHSKGLDAVPTHQIATVITLCADEVCPVFPEDVERLHWPFEDPAAATGSEHEILQEFRRIRDAIRKALEDYFGSGRRQ